MSLCPTCGREFSVESGFCPFDGVALRPAQSDASEGDAAPSGEVGLISFLSKNVSAVIAAAVEDGGYDHLIGETLDGRYQIERKVGEGGMGVVFAGRHAVIEKPVAIKILKHTTSADEDAVRRFVQEARAASRIGHPNIIDVTDFGTTEDGLTYQVMEYIDGTTLASLLRRERRLSLSRALEIVAQIARALLVAHSKGIVHRDLKPDNIFLVRRDERAEFVKIVDFGIAKVAPAPGQTGERRITRAGSIFGTPEYMAPEQAAGRPDVDHRIDIYALGTILYELLTGTVPHGGRSAVKILASQMLDPIEPPRTRCPELEISESLESVVMKALAKMPDDRYDSMAELLDALAAATTPTEFDLEKLVRDERLATDVEARESITADVGAALSAAGQSENVADASDTARNSSTARMRGDPAFVRSPARLPVDNPDAPLAEQRPRRAIGRWVLAAVVLSAGGALAGWYATRGTAASEAVQTADAAVLAASDAGTVDAVVAVADAADTATPDAGVRKRDDAVHRPPAGDVELTVRTDPAGGSLYFGDTFAGSDGLHIVRKRGTELRLTCRKAGFPSGTVLLRFGGAEKEYVCRLPPSGPCIPGLKNPYRKCPDGN